MKLIKLKKRKPNRSRGGDMGIYIMLILFGIFFVIPLVYTVSNAFKPLDEIYLYPPRFFVKNPTFNNFQDLLVVMSNSYVPFTRYVFNTVLTTLVGTVGHLIIGSMAAYVLAKYDFPGGKQFFDICVTALMFNAYVLQIPTYLIMTKLGWVDTYLALIVPAFALPMGLFLMKQFMEQLPDSLIESARLDGAGEFRIFFGIVMPNVKPAWLTLAIFQFQSMWANTGSGFLRSEQLKSLQYSLYQIVGGGPARQGAGAVVQLIIAAIPITFFIVCQSNIIETMTTSGMKD